MSAQQPDIKMEAVVDYGKQAEQEPVAEIDLTATQIPPHCSQNLYCCA